MHFMKIFGKYLKMQNVQTYICPTLIEGGTQCPFPNLKIKFVFVESYVFPFTSPYCLNLLRNFF